jgi:putative endonuclease
VSDRFSEGSSSAHPEVHEGGAERTTIPQRQNGLRLFAIIHYAARVFYVYMMRCRDGSLYVGHTDDLDKRLSEHRARKYCGYTAKRLPVELIFHDWFSSRRDAFAAEQQLKDWSRAKKLALADGDVDLLQRLSLRRMPQPESFLERGVGPSRTSG